MYRALLKFIGSSAPLCSFCRVLSNSDSDELHRSVMNLDFASPIGFASGFDPNADYYNAVSALGGAFEIIGPLSYTESGGIKEAVGKLSRHPASRIKIGINITKREDSSTEEDVARDLSEGFSYAYDFVDFAVFNFAEKADGSVHELAYIKAVIDPVLDMRLSYEESKPILLRLSDRLSGEELGQILDYCLMSGIDGVFLESEMLIGRCREFSKSRLPVIALAECGNPSGAASLLAAGASLIAFRCSPHGFHPRRFKKLLKEIKNDRRVRNDYRR